MLQAKRILQYFIQTWKEFHSDETILNCVRGYDIEFNPAQPMQYDCSLKRTTVKCAVNDLKENSFELK